MADGAQNWGRGMSYNRLIEVAGDALSTMPSGKNVFVLHPQFRYQSALTDALLHADSRKVLYISLSQSGTTLPAVWAALARELESVYQIQLPPLVETSPEAAAQLFSTVVAPLLPLDFAIAAYDYAVDSVHDFVLHTADRLDNQCRIFLSGRSWPDAFTTRTEAADRLALLPVAPDDMLLDYLALDDEKVLLEVHAFGSGRVLIDGHEVNQWDGALPRALFFYFIDRGMTTRDEVFATFWPELTTREATNVFHVTKRKVSEILGVDLTVYSSGFYRLAPHIQLHYDVVSFAEAVQNSAVAEPDEARALLERAIALHERDFLRGFEQSWATRRREELRRTYADALTALARLYEEQDMVIKALGLYCRAFGAFPQREDLARAQMRLHLQAKQPGRALQVYDRLLEELNRTLSVTPSSETTALAEEVRQLLT